jgi:hypothetical protein
LTSIFRGFAAMLFIVGFAMPAPLSMGGHSLETAALSNTGPLLRLAEQGADGYAVFNGPARFLLLTAMILDCLEAAAPPALINCAFWRA